MTWRVRTSTLLTSASLFIRSGSDQPRCHRVDHPSTRKRNPEVHHQLAMPATCVSAVMVRIHWMNVATRIAHVMFVTRGAKIAPASLSNTRRKQQNKDISSVQCCMSTRQASLLVTPSRCMIDFTSSLTPNLNLCSFSSVSMFGNGGRHQCHCFPCQLSCFHQPVQ